MIKSRKTQCLMVEHSNVQNGVTGSAHTWMMISSSMRSVQLSLSTMWAEPLYSRTALPTLISLLNMLTTKSPLSKYSPWLLATAGERRKKTQEMSNQSEFIDSDYDLGNYGWIQAVSLILIWEKFKVWA